MKYQKSSHPVQQLPTGEVLSVHAYTFTGSTSGSRIYLQGNLHGPEIIGSSILGKLITRLEQIDDISGQVIIVPCANPMGVQAVAYNAHIGRWNLHSGTNWNRIFPINLELTNLEEQKKYYQQELGQTNLSIERKLAAILKLLSFAATHVIDIHTSGADTVPHLFTFENASEVFFPLEAKVHFLITPEDASGAFDESHVLPFLKALPKDLIPKVCTWEAHHHGQFDSYVVEDRFQKLWNCLSYIWGNKPDLTRYQPSVLALKNGIHLVAPVAGYYSWLHQVGAVVEAGVVYATVYQPWHNQTLPIKAERKFFLLSKYGIGAIAEGEQLAWIAYL